MDASESPRQRRRRAAAAWLCCCCSGPGDALEPDSPTVRILAGIIAIIAMLASGMGFSALQRATVNPYEHLFTTGSSSKQYITPPAWGPAFAPATGPFLQPMLYQGGNTLSTKGTDEGVPESMPFIQQPGTAPGSAAGATIGSFGFIRAPAPNPDHLQSSGSPGSAPNAPAGNATGGDTASIESASPEDSGAASPGATQADLSSNNSSSGSR